MKLEFLKGIFCIFVFALAAFAQTNGTKLVHSFEEFGCEELKLRTHEFVEEIDKSLDAKGYVIIYEGRYRQYIPKNNYSTFKYGLPRNGEANSRIKLIKKQLLFFKYPIKDIVFINGGFREKLTVEFYVVPKDGEPPKPTPTLDKIRYKKGIAPKLTLGDC
jgi:hypothetical protein